MQAQQRDQQGHQRDQLVQRIRRTIAQKQEERGGRVRFDWRAAEASLLDHAALREDAPQSTAALRLLSDLHSAYLATLTPPFYSYFTIYAILHRSTNVCEELNQEMTKTADAQNEYQNIAVLIHMRSSLAEECRRGTASSEQAEKLRSATILSVIRAHEWQESFGSLLGYPVFFFWGGSAYLPALAQDTQPLHPTLLPHPNPLFLLQSESHRLQDPVIADCLATLKSQKPRLLELTLSLPFYARVVVESTQESKGRSQQRIMMRQSLRMVGSRVSAKGKPDISLSREELTVIRKFRSLKSVKVEVRAQPQSELSRLVADGLRSRIDNLKEKVKNKTESSRIEGEPAPARSGIKIVLEKQVELERGKKSMTDSLSLLQPRRSRSPLREARKEGEQERLHKIIAESKLLMQTRTQQHQQLTQNHQSLKLIKQDLLAKVMGNTRRPGPAPTRNSPSPPHHPKTPERAIIAERVAQEKKALELKSKQLLEEKARVERELEQEAALLLQKQREAQQAELELSLKKVKVDELALRLQRCRSEDSEEAAATELGKAKQKRLMEYDLQKQQMQQAQAALEERLTAEQRRHTHLQQEQDRREQALQQQLQLETERLRAAQAREEALLLGQIAEEQQKQRQHQQRIREEQERVERMAQEARQWAAREQQLAAELRQEQERAEQRERAQRADRRRKIEQELGELEQQEGKFLQQYRQANSMLADQLQALRLNNSLLEAKLARRPPL